MSKQTKEIDNAKSDNYKTSNVRGNRGGNRRKPKGKKGYSPKDNTTNDPQWYSTSPELLRDSASIPFSWPVGTRLEVSEKMQMDVVPGICRIDILPTIGTSLNVNSPVNVAASAIYSWVRHANSGHSNYDAPDLMMYLLAMSNVYSFVVWMQRIYGLVSMYDQRNRYLPEAIVEAEEVNFTDIRDNLANFRYFLNAYINKVSSLAVPATMPIFNRLAFLYANVYIEGPSIKDQLYMYHPMNLGWYKFRLNNETHVGELVYSPVTVTSGHATFSNIVSYANDLFNAIWIQEDFGIMSGDIIKAYDSNVIKLSPVPEVMPMLPVYDAMVLHQMKNAKIAPWIDVSKISQSANGEILQSITINSSETAVRKNAMVVALGSDHILSTDLDNPTPDIVIESTRLMPAYNAYDGVIYAGTEIPTRMALFTFNNNAVLESRNMHIELWANANMAVANVEQLMLKLQLLSSFRYHPEYICLESNGDNITDGKGVRIWDIDNYAVLSNADLQKMHETALLSLFAVPAIAKIS